MVRRVTISQWNSKVRQAQQKQRREIDKANREVKAYNQKVKREVDKANREIKAYNQKIKQGIDKYNRDVRTYNARVRADQQRLKRELSRLAHRSVAIHLTTFGTSVSAVQSAYERLEHAADAGDMHEQYNEILDLSEREAANNAGLLNALLDETTKSTEEVPPKLADSPLTPILHAISPDFGDRWQGALYSLSPDNPDAARHFCTSAREIIAGILDKKAPDNAVANTIPSYERTQRGTPTRRAKIRYILQQKGLSQDDLEAFIEADMDNVVELFDVFNKGTHGSAGKFDLLQLQAIRKRVEDGITFLSNIVD